MKKNHKGFSIVAALALAAVIATGAMFLGKILAYLKTTKLRTQARISSLGYEDSMAGALVARLNGLVTGGGGCASIKADDLNGLLIPGTSVGLNFEAPKPASVTNGTSTIILTARTPGLAGQPASASERFIDNAAEIIFRIDFLNKNSSQDQKMFSAMSCGQFWGLPAGTAGAIGPENRQMKISYQISWTFRGKPIVTTGSKLYNLPELLGP